MLARLLPNDRARSAAVYAGITLLMLFLTQFVFPGSGGGARGTPAAILFSGLLLGLTIAVLACSVVLMYRTLRFINFALGPLGLVGSVLVSYIVVLTNVPFLVALVLGLAASGLLGMLLGVFTLRFFKSSRLFLTVVTITAAGALLQVGLNGVGRLPFWPPPEKLSTDQLRSLAQLRENLPFPGLEFNVGSFPDPFRFGHLLTLELGIIALVGLVCFLRFTRAGTAMRALAENPERASLLGIGVGGLSVMAWTIAGVLDGTAAIMASTGANAVGNGFTALLAPFAAAVFGRFRNVGQTIFAALIIGIGGEAFRFSYRDDQDLFNVALFILVAVGLLFQRKVLARSESADVAWAASNEPRPIPKELSGISSLRITRVVLIVLGTVFVIAFPLLASTGRIVLAGVVLIHAIAVLSLVVLTGWAGQVSLGQFALVAVGSVVGGSLTSQGLSFWLAIPLTIAITAGVAVIVGLPALRIRGLYLLVTTFAFAVAVQNVLFDERYFGWLLPKDEGVIRPTLFFLNFDNEEAMYFLLVASLVATIAVIANLRKSRIGRLLIALRESEANVQSFGVNPVRLKLLAFAIAGGIAGFAGILFAHHARGVAPGSFTADASVNVFIEAVLGGVSSPAGALLGSAYLQISGELSKNNAVVAAFLTAGGPLLIIFMVPGGLVSLVNSARDAVLRIIAQRRRIIVPSLFADYDPEILARQLIPLADPDPTSGLAALPVERRYTLASELYQGKGERIVDKLRPAAQAAEAAALGAAADAAMEREFAESQANDATEANGAPLAATTTEAGA